MRNVRNWIIGVFVTLYVIVSGISTIHVVDFFELSNPSWLAILLAIAFEIGAAACLAAIIILDKTSRWLVWTLFILITTMQCTGNMYYSYSHLADIRNWVELFGLVDQEPMFQKRIMSIIAGAILPIVALGFIKSLVDYIRPKSPIEIEPLIKEAEKTEDQIQVQEASGSEVLQSVQEAQVKNQTDSPDDTYIASNPPQRFGPM